MQTKGKTFEWYYDRFLQGVLYTRDIDYGEKRDVRRNNRGVDMYRDAAKQIGIRYPERIPDFAVLLDHEQEDVRIACAVSVLTLMAASPPYTAKAAEILRALAVNGSSFEKRVWTMWLKDHGVWE